ncbi:MAG TPA: hypothetical protein DCW51_05300 [Clostridium sp.]|nr:hypothetical protein [Clostridium sp.]
MHDPTITPAILDRIVHSSYTLEISGNSMRKLGLRLHSLFFKDRESFAVLPSFKVKILKIYGVQSNISI